MADKDGSSLDHERMIVLDVDDDSDDVSPSAVSPVRMTSAKSTTSMSSRFKGVVPQPNGRWGAQIYEKHHRVWLGTFDTESDAARSYDVAARRFRGGEAITNFSQTAVDDAEAEFLSSRSKAEIVDMLRKHTYSEELLQSCRRRVLGGPAGQKKRTSADDVGREELFEKAVTPSDVGKLNRLVIPKQHAEKHFPLKPASLLLSFEDVSNGKVWRFRYSYWNSSQSYVLTKGWSRFVKEKGLNAGDLVLFHRSIGPEKQIFIECKSSSSSSSAPVIRLFGVNISQVLDQVQGSCGCRNNQTTTTTTTTTTRRRRRRRRDQMERLPLHNLVKKQCVRDLQ